MAEKALIQAQLDEITRQHADLESSFEARLAELEAARAALERLGADLPEARLAEAFTALETGDTSRADALFAEVQAMEEDAVARAATAVFERGKLAEADIRWADAAEHYTTAAWLAPSFDRLFKAREFAWRSGDYAAASRFGEELIAAAIAEHGEGSEAHATTLNEHALTLKSRGRYAEAEPLYREALAIEDKTLGKAHPDYAASLNNLAGLLADTGRHAEAEPLYREALEIFIDQFGPDHPHTRIVAENLIVLESRAASEANLAPE
jgi:tetratricopeptide (TPR) repeat protein